MIPAAAGRFKARPIFGRGGSPEPLRRLGSIALPVVSLRGATARGSRSMKTVVYVLAVIGASSVVSARVRQRAGPPSVAAVTYSVPRDNAFLRSNSLGHQLWL